MTDLHKPTIQAVGTAVPPHRVSQEQAREFAARLFSGRYQNIDRLLPIFHNSRIQYRHLSQPADWYGRPHTFPEANALYEQVALELVEEAAAKAMEQAQVAPEEIGLVLFVSSTGIATPSLDSKLIQNLGLSPHTARLPIWGLGCAGGVAGLARAADLTYAVSGRSVLLVAVELCSLTFQHNDISKANLVATSLFGDGAAAVLLKLDDQLGPKILNSHSTLFPDSEDIMGWDVVDTGLKVRFARSIPVLVEREMAGLVAAACQQWQIDQTDLQHFVFHPGGPKVLDAYANSLGLVEGQLGQAYEIWECYGNMSSPTVLFVLEAFLKQVVPTNKYGLIAALGPGFSAEQLLFRW